MYNKEILLNCLRNKKTIKETLVLLGIKSRNTLKRYLDTPEIKEVIEKEKLHFNLRQRLSPDEAINNRKLSKRIWQRNRYKTYKHIDLFIPKDIKDEVRTKLNGKTYSEFFIELYKKVYSK